MTSPSAAAEKPSTSVRILELLKEPRVASSPVSMAAATTCIAAMGIARLSCHCAAFLMEETALSTKAMNAAVDTAPKDIA